MAIWLLLQWGAFTLGSLQIELASGSAGFPRPAERLTAYYLVVVQIGASALFFPALLQSWVTAAMAIVAVWPFQLAAAALAGDDFGLAAKGAAYASAWLVGLAILAHTFPWRRVRMAAASVAALLAWGGAMGGYLSHEFGPPPSSTAFPTSVHFGPIFDSLSLLSTGRWSGNWAFIILFLCACVGAGLGGRIFSSRLPRAQSEE